MSGPMPWIFFLIFQVLVSTTITPLAAGEGCRIEIYSLQPSIENTMWNGFGYLPTHSGSSMCAIFFQLRGSGSLESNTEQLFSRRLFIMQRKFPSGEKPISCPGEKILSNVTSQWSLSIFLTGYWFGAFLLN